MSAIIKFNNLADIATHFRKDLTGDNRKEKDLVLFFAHNGTGKTRLSMEFKQLGKEFDADGSVIARDTLYFNAFTEDLFSWHNDLENDTERFLKLNTNSAFFDGLRELELDAKIRSFFQVISTHHSLFFNVLFNEFGRKAKNKRYFLHFKDPTEYSLQDTNDTPFFHHIATLSELKQVVESNRIYTFHFNALRSVLEKTATFFGYDKIDNCIHGLEDEVLFERALQLFSHGKYSIFDPVEMGDDNKQLFGRILNGFVTKYEFHFPEIFNESNPAATT